MMKKALLFIFMFHVFLAFTNGQSMFSAKHAMSAGGKKRYLTFQYFGIDRKRAGGNTDLELKTNFSYLNIFDGSQRFAPDEPSTFSSLEYTFFNHDLPHNFSYEISAGIFRNHIKGDFILEKDKVHFGRGNSQVGVSSTLLLLSPSFFHEKLTVGFSTQLGIGPHFTRLTAGEDEVSPGAWGIRGWGLASNLGLWLNSPIFLKRLMIGAGTVYNISYSKYGDFSVKNKNNGAVNPYENIHFTAVSKRPVFTLVLKYNLAGKNERNEKI